MDFILTWSLYHAIFLSPVHRVDLDRPVLSAMWSVSPGDTAWSRYTYSPDGKEILIAYEDGYQNRCRIVTDAQDRVQSLEFNPNRNGGRPSNDRWLHRLRYGSGTRLDSVILTRNDTLIATEAYTLDSLGRPARVRKRERSSGQEPWEVSERTLIRDPLGSWLILDYAIGDDYRYEYDGSGRVIAKKFRTGDTAAFNLYQTFTYDAGGLLARSDNHNPVNVTSTTYYEYAPLSRVLGIPSGRKALSRPGFHPVLPAFGAGHDLRGRRVSGRR